MPITKIKYKKARNRISIKPTTKLTAAQNFALFLFFLIRYSYTLKAINDAMHVQTKKKVVWL